MTKTTAKSALPLLGWSGLDVPILDISSDAEFSAAKASLPFALHIKIETTEFKQLRMLERWQKKARSQPPCMSGLIYVISRNHINKRTIVMQSLMMNHEFTTRKPALSCRHCRLQRQGIFLLSEHSLLHQKHSRPFLWVFQLGVKQIATKKQHREGGKTTKKNPTRSVPKLVDVVSKQNHSSTKSCGEPQWQPRKTQSPNVDLPACLLRGIVETLHVDWAY